MEILNILNKFTSDQMFLHQMRPKSMLSDLPKLACLSKQLKCKNKYEIVWWEH